LAAVSALLTELQLYDPDHFARNLVRPAPRSRNGRRAVSSLYRRHPARIPHILPPADLRAIFVALPSWRDRTLMLLMWVSCLRVSEVVALHLVETVTHGWDLAKATGQHPAFDPDVVRTAAQFTQGERPPSAAFAAPVPVADDLPEIDRLAALLGRTP